MTVRTSDDRPTTIKTWAEVGEDGVLKLDVAPGYYEVLLVRTVKKPATIHPSWPAGYWETVIGSIDDPSFKRYPQPMSDETPPPGQE